MVSGINNGSLHQTWMYQQVRLLEGKGLGVIGKGEVRSTNGGGNGPRGLGWNWSSWAGGKMEILIGLP